MKYFFCGIGGIGMSGIALLLANKGQTVIGSDRDFDKGCNNLMKERLIAAGITIVPQDGSGVVKDIATFVVSTAVEKHIADVARAIELKLPICKRAELLALIFNKMRGIAVGGTSGKTTVTAMIAHILHRAGFAPTMINGGISVDSYHNQTPSNLIVGNGKWCVIEADESDGSIALYQPQIAVLNNLSLDHKSLEELKELFSNFIKTAQMGVVINADDKRLVPLQKLHPHTMTFSIQKKKADFVATDIQTTEMGMSFKINGQAGTLSQFGEHNVQNALAAIAATAIAGVSLTDALEALASFHGTKRRLEKIGEVAGVEVFDDYAHNPNKITAAIKTLRTGGHRLWIFFQPHGFAPTRLMKDELIDVFATQTGKKDLIFMPDIFYAGGTVAKDIASKDLINALVSMDKNAFYVPSREAFLSRLTDAQAGDRIVVMGARDSSLSDFALQIISHLQEIK